MSSRSLTQTSLWALVVMAFINIIWGAAYPITKPALLDMPPMSFAFWRFVVALLVLIPLAPRATWALITGPERKRFFVMGLIGFCITQITQVEALVLSPATHIALLSATTPLWVAVLAHYLLGEHITKRMLLGIFIAICGMFLVLNPQSSDAVGWGAIIGYAIYLVSAFCWGMYNVMGRTLMQTHPPVPATAAATFYGVICLLPFAAGEYAFGMVTHLTVATVSGILYTGLLVTVVGYLALFWALQRATSGKVSAMMYFQPIAGVAVAWVWLHEQPTYVFFVGSALTLLGVWFVTSQKAVTDHSITATEQ
jgi:drug/metabolite transporter (DMT)-like permease